MPAISYNEQINKVKERCSGPKHAPFTQFWVESKLSRYSQLFNASDTINYFSMPATRFKDLEKDLEKIFKMLILDQKMPHLPHFTQMNSP